MALLRNLTARCFRRFDLSGLYFDRIGLKSYNQLVSSSHLALFVSGHTFSVSSTELHLGFDGLVDSETLLGTGIDESPHLDLAQKLEENEDIDSSDYVNRVRRGTLDFRPSQYVADPHIDRIKTEFNKCRNQIERNAVDSVKVFEVAGSLYIADGKHRAAVCHMLGKNVLCADMTPAIYDSFYHWVFRKMNQRAAEFQKHILWLENAYKKIK